MQPLASHHFTYSTNINGMNRNWVWASYMDNLGSVGTGYNTEVATLTRDEITLTVPAHTGNTENVNYTITSTSAGRLYSITLGTTTPTLVKTFASSSDTYSSNVYNTITYLWTP